MPFFSPNNIKCMVINYNRFALRGDGEKDLERKE